MRSAFRFRADAWRLDRSLIRSSIVADDIASSRFRFRFVCALPIDQSASCILVKLILAHVPFADTGPRARRAPLATSPKMAVFPCSGGRIMTWRRSGNVAGLVCRRTNSNVILAELMRNPIRLTIVLLVGLCPLLVRAGKVPTGPRPGMMEHFTADRMALQRKYGVPTSAEERDRLGRFYQGELHQLDGIDFDSSINRGRWITCCWQASCGLRAGNSIMSRSRSPRSGR